MRLNLGFISVGVFKSIQQGVDTLPTIKNFK